MLQRHQVEFYRLIWIWSYSSKKKKTHLDRVFLFLYVSKTWSWSYITSPCKCRLIACLQERKHTLKAGLHNVDRSQQSDSQRLEHCKFDAIGVNTMRQIRQWKKRKSRPRRMRRNSVAFSPPRGSLTHLKYRCENAQNAQAKAAHSDVNEH